VGRSTRLARSGLTGALPRIVALERLVEAKDVHKIEARIGWLADEQSEVDQREYDVPDVSLEGNRNLTLRIRDRERKLITKIDEALGRIDDGTYGVCEECGGLIGVERLKARPVTTLCIQCKSEQEAEERRRKFA
jgi:DnaK suppressor protein